MELPKFSVGPLGLLYEMCYCPFDYYEFRHEITCDWRWESEWYDNYLPKEQELYRPYKIKMFEERTKMDRIFQKVRDGFIEVDIDLEDYCTECNTYEEHLSKGCFVKSRSRAFMIAMGDLNQKYVTENLPHVRAMLDDRIARNNHLLKLKLQQKTELVHEIFSQLSESDFSPAQWEQVKLNRDRRIQRFSDKITREKNEMVTRIMENEQQLTEQFLQEREEYMKSVKARLDDCDIKNPVTGPILKSTVPPKRLS